MKNRIIPRLEVLEDKLPPGSLSGIADFFPHHAKNSLIEPRLAVRSQSVIPSHLIIASAFVEVEPQLSARPFQNTSKSNLKEASRTEQAYGIAMPSLLLDSSLEKLGVNPSSSKHAKAEFESASIQITNCTALNSLGRFTGQTTAFVFQMGFQNPLGLALLTAAAAQSHNTQQPNSDEPMLAAGIGGLPGDPNYYSDNDDGYRMELNTVTFFGDDFKEVTSDLSQTVYAPPHWVDSANHNNRDDRTENLPVGSNLPGKNMGQPVSYKRNTVMEATINVDLIYIPPPPGVISDLPPQDKTVFLQGVTKYLQGSQFHTIYSNVIVVGDPKTNINYEFEMWFTPLMDTVYHWDNMVVSWQYSYSVNPPPINHPGWMTFNQSRNANYVTYEKPVTGMTLFLTLAYFGTLHAHGENSEQGTVDKMWEYGFKDAAGMLRAEDSENLHYYRGWLTKNLFFADMLKDISVAGAGDGQCNAWADFWIESLKAHGINGAVKKKVESLTPFENMVVKNWTFGTKNVNPAYQGKYEYKNTFNFDATNTDTYGMYDNTQYLFNAPITVVDDSGTPGQNSGNPRSIFDKHFIVNFNGTYYDPSYGKTYNSLRDFDDIALAGYCIIKPNGEVYFRENDLHALEIQ